MNENPTIKPKILPPLTKFIYTIGALPTSYLMSMTYEEQLVWLCNYLGKEVIPAINQNGAAVEELQKLYTDLQSYVDNYFDNLDIQEEVDNKLEEMAQSGELAEIIALFLDTNVITGFDTVAIMKQTTILAAGSITKTAGKDTYNDGKGAFYRVRERINADVPDDDNLVVLVNTDNLIAEKLFSKDIQDINDEIDLMNSQDSIFLGDSYAAGTTYESGSVQYLTSWCEYLRQLMGLTTGHYYKFAQGNAGFAKIGNNSMNFQMTLNSHLDDITNKNAIKNIFVCAGYNDYDQTRELIDQRIGEFVSFCKTNFPNAQVYIGMIGGDTRDNESGRNVREKLITFVLNTYNKCNKYGAIYLTGVEYFTHNFAQFNSQGNHPNEAGYQYVANMIYNAWKGGSASLYETFNSLSLDTNFSNKFNYQVLELNDKKTLYIDNYMANNVNLSDVTDAIQIVPATQTTNGVKPTINGRLQVPVDLAINSSGWKIVPGILKFYADGSISVVSSYLAFNHTVGSFVIWPSVTTHDALLS